MVDSDTPVESSPAPEPVTTEPLPSSRWGKAESPPPPSRGRSTDVYLLLIVVLLLGAYLRFLNVDWDEGHHLHPDERYLTMVAGGVRIPDNLGDYLNSYESSLNPFNQGYTNYAYGTLPLFVTRYAGEWLNQGCRRPPETPGGPERSPAKLQSWVAQALFGPIVKDCVGGEFTGYGKVHLLGRLLAALADLGVMGLLFLIGRRLYGQRVGLLAAGLYAFAVLPIQQAHFFTVDPYANLFVVSALYFSIRGAQKGGWFSFGAAGLSFGLALACKVSVWPFVGVIVLAAVALYLRGCQPDERKAVLDGLMLLLVGLGFALIAITAALGLATAVKLTLYLAILALLSGGLILWLRRTSAQPRQVSVDGAVARLALAGLLAFFAFRLAQPYAFAGAGFDVNRWQEPEYDWFRPHVPDVWHTLHDLLPEPVRALILPDPRFVGALGSVNTQLTGEADVPWGHQWADRTPFVFPWLNMVVWGMGIPLGLAAWAGWLLAARDLWHGRRRLTHLLPWIWVLFLFFYQGTQWVKSIRYILQIYPALILLAAWWLVSVWRTKKDQLRITFYGLRFTVLLVILGTLLWGWGFSRIYARPITRLAASRWMRDNIPPAVTLHYQVDGQPRQHFVSVGGSFTYTDTDVFQVHKLTLLPEQGVSQAQVTGVTFTHLGDPQNDPEPETFVVRLAQDIGGEQVLAQAEQTLHLEASAHILGDARTFHFEPAPLRLGQDYYLFTQAMAGAPVNLDTTVIANEHFDDSLPYPVDGFNPFGGAYRGLRSSGDGRLGLYNDDNVSKRQDLYQWLDEADVIAMSSNRLYASIPRIPSRFPLTIEYYRALFAEELGFDLIASFSSFITVGPFQFPDQETPFPPDDPTLIEHRAAPVSVHLPPAEEAFSVYDHPQVLIFCKTADYSRAKVEAVLEKVDLSQVVSMTAREATETPNALMLTPEEWERQRAGGTWSDIFDPDDWINRSPLVAVIVWWLLIQLLGLFALPLLFVAVPSLPDRAYPFAKSLGLLLWAALAWWAGNTGGRLTYSRGVIFACFLLLGLVAGGVAWRRRREIWAWGRREWRAILVGELLFNLLFGLFLLIRYANPDVWHPYMGGERPMELAYLSAIVKSSAFPPYDPWFAGGAMNYYYFGWVMVATPIKLLGLLPEIAFNLALPTFFGLTGAGAYSLAYNLMARRQRREPAPRAPAPPNPESPNTQHATSIPLRSTSGTENTQHVSHSAPLRGLKTRNPTLPLIAGLIAAIFVVVLGNLGQVRLLVDTLAKLGSQGLDFESTIPGLRELVEVGRGVWLAVVDGKPMPWAPNWPYWNASRVIPHPPGEAEPITEFPFFTFLYGDLHPHLMAMPLTLLALALGLNWVFDADFWWVRRLRWSALYRPRWIGTLWSLTLGGLVLGALRPTNTWDYATHLVMAALVLILGHLVQRNSGWGWAAIRGRLLAVGGRFSLLAGLSYLFFLPYIERYATAYQSLELWQGSKTPVWAYLVVHGLFLFPIVTWLALKVWRWAQARASERTLPWIGAAVLGVLFATALALLKGYLAALVVLPVGALALLVLLESESRPTERFIALLVLASLGLTLVVEVIVLKGDISRMNTVFKFYLQVWLMLGVSAATCLVWLFRGEPQSTNLPIPHKALDQLDNLVRNLWLAIMLLLIVLASLYPIFATWAKVRHRYVREVGPGLDGLAWMKQAVTTQGHAGEYGQRTYPLLWDYQALMWLRENVEGSPVVAEGANGPAYRSQRSRVAVYTGLPIILGWDWHQRQQRSALDVDLIGTRMRDVNDLFNTPDPQHARVLLDRYDVALIYLGELERAYYDPVGLRKFEQMVERGWLTRVYQNEGVTIYEVLR